MLPYKLEGESEGGIYENDFAEQNNYKNYVKTSTSRSSKYLSVLKNKMLRQITLPLGLIWIYREYIYFSSTTMIPELGEEHSNIYFLTCFS